LGGGGGERNKPQLERAVIQLTIGNGKSGETGEKKSFSPGGGAQTKPDSTGNPRGRERITPLTRSHNCLQVFKDGSEKKGVTDRLKHRGRLIQG